ncbi:MULTISPECIES: hypothetical protein [Streptomyces]|uniref:Uncharacterized protein n=1 Tax=Streptomyces odorifer TaxID=53450 RepID=A0A7Y6CDG3_9ACTN|nr:hypothetical protein [Streptomyces odorifer]NUV30967.1 hypothetical protein [Streptomyces odorifer]NUV37408.1 hypothetical protein [Streptomyces sp. KAI-27]NUV48517.1 hypothetical protein [Streptomyces sp. CAI-78]
MVPRRGLRIDLVPRELHIVLICVSGAMLAVQADVASPVAVLVGFLLSVRVRIRRI